MATVTGDGAISRRGFLRTGLAGLAWVTLPGCGGGGGGSEPALSPEDQALVVRLDAGARAVFQANRMDSELGLLHLPSAQTYRSLFAWDSGWNVIALSLLDPEAAYRELETVFSQQLDSGQIPHEVLLPGVEERDPIQELTYQAVKAQYDDAGRSRFIDPPSFLLAAEVLYRRTGDPRVLDLLPAMERCVDYLLGSRDLFGDGLVSIIHPWESGTDAAPFFDEPMDLDITSSGFFMDFLKKYPALLNEHAELGWDLEAIAQENRFVFEDAGINGITAAGLLAMGTLYDGANRPEDRDRCQGRARDMIASMEGQLWDEDAGFFYPRYDLESPRPVRRRCLSGLAPLITGLVAPEKAARVIQGALASPDHFHGPHLVPFSSRSELEEEIPNEDALLWRGHCIWANMNWLAARGAAACGAGDLAREITRATARMVDLEGFREYYDSRTGAGAGAQGFTWPALVLDMIDEHGI